eukprot:363646-Chlamydomonas_euryale.AAC.5
MPSSSSALIKLASLYRGGGRVVCCSGNARNTCTACAGCSATSASAAAAADALPLPSSCWSSELLKRLEKSYTCAQRSKSVKVWSRGGVDVRCYGGVEARRSGGVAVRMHGVVPARRRHGVVKLWWCVRGGGVDAWRYEGVWVWRRGRVEAWRCGCMAVWRR